MAAEWVRRMRTHGCAHSVAPPGASGTSGPLSYRYFRRNGFMRLRSFATLLAIALFAWPAAAQEQRGSLEGIVKDSSAAGRPVVTITLDSTSRAKLVGTTDAQGQYRFPSLLPG